MLTEYEKKNAATFINCYKQDLAEARKGAAIARKSGTDMFLKIEQGKVDRLIAQIAELKHHVESQEA